MISTNNLAQLKKQISFQINSVLPSSSDISPPFAMIKQLSARAIAFGHTQRVRGFHTNTFKVFIGNDEKTEELFPEDQPELRVNNRTLSELLRLGKSINRFPISTRSTGFSYTESTIGSLFRDCTIQLFEYLSALDLMKLAATCVSLIKLIYDVDVNSHLWSRSTMSLCLIDKAHTCYCNIQNSVSEIYKLYDYSLPFFPSTSPQPVTVSRRPRIRLRNHALALSLLSSCSFHTVEIHAAIQFLAPSLLALSSRPLRHPLRHLHIFLESDGSHRDPSHIAFNPREFLRLLSPLSQNIAPSSSDSDPFGQLKSLRLVDGAAEEGIYEVGLAGWTRLLRILGGSIESLTVEAVAIPGLLKVILKHSPALRYLSVSFKYSLCENPRQEIVSYSSRWLLSLELRLFDPKHQRFGLLDLPALRRMAVIFGGSSWHWDEEYLQQTMVTIPRHIRELQIRLPGLFANEAIALLSHRLDRLETLDLQLYDMGASAISGDSLRLMCASNPYLRSLHLPEEVVFKSGAMQLLQGYHSLESLRIRGTGPVLDGLFGLLDRLHCLRGLVLVGPVRRVGAGAREAEGQRLGAVLESLRTGFPRLRISLEEST